MSTDFNESIAEIQTHEDKLTTANARVARFSYTEYAYQSDCADGVAEYNYDQEQNIPLGNPAVLNTVGYILDKGVRSQASSITRMLLNHFFGRVSYNVNKLADYMKSFLATFKTFLKEGDNAWSATVTYETGDLVFIVTNLAGKKSKRTFIAIQESTNLPPADTVTGNLLNTSYWTEISGNFASINADGDIRINGQLIAEKDIVAHGNLYVDGNITATTETQVATSGDFLVTRESNNTPMSQGDFSGLAVNNYATGKMATLTADHCGEWRASDSATVSSVVYTALSQFEGTFYEGLTCTVASAYPTHVMTNVQLIELDGVVFYNGNYYDKIGEEWHGPVTVVNNAFVTGSVITDPAVISALEALTPSSLVYYITVTDNEIDASQNQPLLTRSESACFADKDLLMWDSAERKAVPIPKPTAKGTVLTGCFDPNTHALLSYAWSSAGTATCAICACLPFITRASASSDRQLIFGETSYSSNDYSSLYTSANCPLTFNPATGELKTGKLDSCCSRTTLYTRDIHFGVISGCYSYRLLQDITDWYNASNSVPVKQMVGNLFIHKSGWSVAKMYQVNMNHNPYRGGCPLSTDSDKEIFKVGAILGNSYCVFDKCTWPVIVCENATGRVYTAIRKKGQIQDVCVTFSGLMNGDPVSCLVCSATNTQPTGWTELLEAGKDGTIACANVAESFREVHITMCNNCWLKLGSFLSGFTGDILKFSLSRSYSSQQPEQHDITILAGKLAPASTRVIEDANGWQLFSCIRFGYSSCYACPVDIYVKYNYACSNPVRISYCNTSPVNGGFIPSFTQVSDTCASACACICNIPLHETGHYINGCQFDTSCVNTACVNTACVNASYVCASQYVVTNQSYNNIILNNADIIQRSVALCNACTNFCMLSNSFGFTGASLNCDVFKAVKHVIDIGIGYTASSVFPVDGIIRKTDSVISRLYDITICDANTIAFQSYSMSSVTNTVFTCSCTSTLAQMGFNRLGFTLHQLV